MSIVVFLIIVLISYLIYVPVWSSIFLAAIISVNKIDHGSRDGVVLRFLAPLPLILAAVMLVLLIFFAGLTSNFISIKLKNGQPYLLLHSGPRFFSFTMFF